MDIANLVIRVTNDGLTAAQRELRRLRDEVNRNVDANKKMKEGLDDLSKWAAIGLGALTGGIVLATKKAMSFETAMAGVNKTVDFTTKNGLSDLKNELLELSRVIPLPFEELADIAAAGGQGGIADKQLGKYTETIAKMAIAFDMAAGQTSDSMAKIANVFGTPIEEIGNLGDAVNTLSNNMASTAPDIIDFMLRVGGSAKAMNISAEATAALGSSLVSLGLSQEVAGTAMAGMLTTLLDNESWSKSAAGAFSDLGLATEEFTTLVANDGVAALLQVREAIMALPKDEQIPYLSQMFGVAGVKAAGLFTSLELLDSALAMVGEGAEKTTEHLGSMEEEFTKMADTSANAMQLTKNMIDAATASIGEAFLPVLNDLLLQLAPVIDKVTAWATANPELIRQIALITASVLASIIGIKLFADGIAAAITTIENLKTAFNLAKTALTILSGGFALPLLAIAALIAAGVLLYQNWDLVKEKASELNEWVKSKFGSLPEPLQQAGRDIAQVFMFIWNTGKEYLTLMGELYSGTFESFATIATGVFQVVWSIIKVSFAGIVNTVSTTLQIIATLFSSGFALIKNTVTMVLDVIKAVISGDFKAIPGIIGNGLKGAVTIVGNMMGQILDIIKNYGKKLYSIGRDFIQGFINGIKSVGTGVASAATTMVGNAIAAVKKRQDSASPSKVTTKLGGDFSQGMANGIKKGAKVVKTEAQKMAEQAISAVKTGVENLKREIALFGNDSPVAALKYDISVGKYGGADTSQLMSLTQTKEQLELSKKITDANKAMQDSIDGLTKQLALFGNKSSLADFDFDVGLGKHAGVSQSNIDKTRELLRALDMRNEEADVTKEMISLQRSIYDASVLYSTELGRMNYELDDVHGKYKNINEEIKDSLRNEAAKLDAVKLQATAVKSMMDIDRQMSLLGDSGSFSQLAYEMSEATGSLYDLDEGLKEAWLSKAALLDQARLELAINESIDKSLGSINKEIALMATSGSAIAELNYDLLNTDKYLHASQESVWNLREALTKLDNLKKGDALSAVMGEIAQESPLGKIEADYQRRLEIIDDYESQWTSLVGVHSAERTAIEQSYMNAKRDLLLSGNEKLFGSLASIAKGFAGEQLGIYRAMFAVEKGLALARVLLASKTALALAWASAPFPANLGAVAIAAAETGVIQAAVGAINPKGFKQGGYTGNMGASQVAGVVHGQEYVFDAQSTKRIGVDNLNAMRSGKAPAGGDVSINIINNSSARVEASSDGKTITITDVRNEVKRGFTELQNPNSHSSKMVKASIKAPRNR